MNRYITKEAFEFMTFNGGTIPITIGKGVLISYETYTHEPALNPNNAVRITVYGPNSNLILDGPNIIGIENYLREIGYNDLVHPKEYIREQENYHKEQDEANYNKRINTAAVLNYLKKAEKANYDTPGKPLFDKSVANGISHQIAVKQKELERRDVLAATDEDIIQNALMEYGNQERYNGDVEIANKITDVRNRYLEMLCESKNKE